MNKNTKIEKFTPMKLKALQEAFSQTLLYQPSDIALQLKEKTGFTTDQLLQIHRNNFVISVTESLKAVYNCTLQLVGDEFFESVARHYILNNPPIENNIRVYGEGFPEYLVALPQLADMPYIAEMAKFESLYEHAQNFPIQQGNFDPQALQQVAADDFAELQFLIRSDCTVFDSPQNIYLLFNMIKNNDVKEADLNHQCYLLLQKLPDFSISVIELSQPQWQLIKQLQEKVTLENLQPSSLQEQLSDLLTANLISGFTINENKGKK